MIAQRLIFCKNFLIIRQQCKLVTGKFLSRTFADKKDEFSRQNVLRENGPSQRKDPNAPLIFADDSKVKNISRFIERPFIFNRRKVRIQHQRKIINSKKNNILELEENKIKHPTVKLAFELFNSATEDAKGMKKRTSKYWRPKSPNDYINDHFLKNQAHLLGLTENELKNRFDFLCNLGIDKMDSLTIALNFPSSLDLCKGQVENLAKLYLSNKINLTKMFVMYPFVFGLSYEEVSKRLDYLGTTGLKRKEIGDLINTNPVILCFDLNESSKDSLKFCSGLSRWKSNAGKSLFIEAILKTSLAEKAVKYELNEMFESITSFLEQLQVSVSNVFKRCPEFFSSDMETIYRVMHYLTDAPFFFDIEALSKFIHKHPDIYLKLDEEEIKAKIKRICDILGDESELFEIMQATPKMFAHSQCVEDRMSLFLRWKFTNKHLANLMKRFPLFFYDNRVVENLDERLEFLLGANDLTVNQIMKFPSCLQMRIAVLTCKIGYIRKYKPEILKNTDLQTIFAAKDKEFAVDICSTSTKLYHQYIDENFSAVEVKLIKKKGADEKNVS